MVERAGYSRYLTAVGAKAGEHERRPTESHRQSGREANGDDQRDRASDQREP